MTSGLPHHAKALLKFAACLVPLLSVHAAAAYAEPPAAAITAENQPDPRAGYPLAARNSVASTERYGDPEHTNLSGIWQMQGAFHLVDIGNIRWTPAYAAKIVHATKMANAGSPILDTAGQCIALGMPHFMMLKFESVQTPGEIVMTDFAYMDWRRIYIDGRGHSKEFDPDYNGDSIGHWDGAELVVETNNFSPQITDILGSSFSDKLSIVEHFRRISSTQMEVATTLTDPEALLEPFSYKRTYDLLAPGFRLENSRCTNNRDFSPPKADAGGQ